MLLELTDYAYVAALAFWADITTLGKILSKIFQRDHVLLSDVTSGVEDSEEAMGKLATSPGRWMLAFATDYDDTKLALDGIELHSIGPGKTQYATEMADVCSDLTAEINARFCGLLSNPVLRAAVVFEHGRWPGFSSARSALEAYGDEKARPAPPPALTRQTFTPTHAPSLPHRRCKPSSSTTASSWGILDATKPR